MDCIFCKIINKEIPAEIVYENEHVLAFKDINPEAKVHILFIPKKHLASVNSLDSENKEIVGEIFLAMKTVAKDLGIAEDGYRIVTNTGEKAGQTVHHLHFHLLSGREFKWPPG